MEKEKKNLPISDAIGYGWETFKKNWVLFVVLALISAILGAPQSTIEEINSNETASTIISLIFSILSLIISIGITKITLRVYDGEKPEILDVFRYTRLFWRFLGASILYTLIVSAGILLLIVPGIIWALKYGLMLKLIIDKDMGIIDALNKSAELTQGVKLQLVMFGFVAIGVFILGALALGVGLFVAIPVIWIADVYIYRFLLGTNPKTTMPLTTSEQSS